MYTLDASVFLSDLDTNSAHHSSCNTLMGYLHTTITPIVVPSLILAELASVLSQELHDPRQARLVVSLLRSMQHIRLVGLNDGLAQDAVDIASSYELSACSAIYVAVARQFDATLVTLDQHVYERVAAIVPVMTPADLLKTLQ